ncbi:MAG: TolC family protein [Nibricoccus sp.]
MTVVSLFSRKSLLLAVALLVPALSGRAAATEPLSLETALQIALENNPTLQAASGRIDAATGRAIQARAWSNPELELAAEDWPLRSRGYKDSKRTIGLSQTIPFPGKRSLGKQAGGAGVKVSEAERAMRRLELVRDVKIAFCRVLTLERQVALSAKLLAVANDSSLTAGKRVEAGAAPLQEQLRAEVQAEQAKAEAGDLQRELAAARQALAAELGRPDLVDAKLAGELAEQPTADLLARADGDALETHPAIRAAQANLERAELESRRARLEAYPDVKVGVAAGEAGETGQSIGQVSLSLPLPLLDRGKGLRQEARANVNVAKAELHAMRLQLQRDLADAAGRYRTACQQVKGYRERILPKAVEALRLVQAGYEEGKFGFADLVDTQRTTAEVQMTYQSRLLEMNAAHAELEALLITTAPKS